MLETHAASTAGLCEQGLRSNHGQKSIQAMSFGVGIDHSDLTFFLGVFLIKILVAQSTSVLPLNGMIKYRMKDTKPTYFSNLNVVALSNHLHTRMHTYMHTSQYSRSD